VVVRRAGEPDDEAGVVFELGVVGDQAAAQPFAADAGGGAQQLRGVHAAHARQLAAGGAGGAAQAVAEGESDARLALGARGDLRRERDRLADRADKVGRGLRQQDVTLARALHRDAERALGEVAQAAVDELGAPTAGAPGEVAALDERDAQAAGRGVEGGAGAGDAAADDEDVERAVLVLEGREVRGALGGVEHPV
jgi:hypothetical protein